MTKTVRISVVISIVAGIPLLLVLSSIVFCTPQTEIGKAYLTGRKVTIGMKRAEVERLISPTFAKIRKHPDHDLFRSQPKAEGVCGCAPVKAVVIIVRFENGAVVSVGESSGLTWTNWRNTQQ